MPESSVKTRFAFSVLANALRGGLTLITALILARSLGVVEYGNYAFLIGSFAAIKILLEMGTATAFYTFISQKPRDKIFLFAYAAYQLVQFILPLLVISTLFPQDWISSIWVGQDRELVLLSFAAVFMQQQAWTTMIRVGESLRLTKRVQAMNVSIALAHLLIICALWIVDLLALKLLFFIISIEYVVSIVVALKVLKISSLDGEPFEGRKVFHEYLVYCSPLFVYSLLGFAHEFADRWLLQNFGGAPEQGVYEISYRFATVSLLAATSILNIFWKEFAEAQEQKKFEQMRVLYKKVSRFLFTVGAIFGGLLIPWTGDIVRLLLGPTYISGASVLAIMLVFSIYVSLAQINGTLMYAASRTKEYLFFGMIFMAISLPLSYFIQAPGEAAIPGLGLGATGMAIKKTILIFMQVNLLNWWIGRCYGWKFDWIYQAVSLSGCLFLGWVAYKLAITLITPVSTGLIFAAGTSLVFYTIMIGLMIFMFPWVAGLRREEFLRHFKSSLKIFGY